MSDEIMNVEDNDEVEVSEAVGQTHVMLEYIAQSMKAQMVDPNTVHLEFPVCIELTVDPDFHYADLVNGMNNQGSLYLAKAMWKQAHLLEDVLEYLPVLDSERDRSEAESVEEVVESE